jgi:hypothetical protein
MPYKFNPFTGNLDYYESGSGGSSNSFVIWQPPTGTSPTASSSSDTMTLTSSDGSLIITGNSTTDTLDFKLAGPVSVANGGTNSATSLNNNRVMKSSSGAVVEAAAITASRALVSDSNGIPTHATTTSTEIGFVSGVTSAIQTQLTAKAPIASPTFTGTQTCPGLAITGSATVGTDNTYDLGVWNGNRLRNGSFSSGLNIGTAPDRQDGGVIECGSATNMMVQFGTINGMLTGIDGLSAFRDKAMGVAGQLYGIGKAKASAVLNFFKWDINSAALSTLMTIDGATGNVRVTGNLGVGNSATASTLGTVVKKIQIFDASGTSLGYLPVYDSIT